MLRWLTAGESHGRALVAICEGMPAGVQISTADVATGAATETVNFTLQPGITAGRYLLEVVAAGISSVPWRIHITQAEIDGL